MIPSSTVLPAIPLITGSLLFHVIVADSSRTFSMDGPSDLNGIRIHHEMIQAMRDQKQRLREFDLRADSQTAALAEMSEYFPGYVHVGSWADTKSRNKAVSAV